VSLRAPARPDLHGHKAERENICYSCGGELRDTNGNWNTAMVDNGGRLAFAAAICRQCKEEETIADTQPATNLKAPARKRVRTGALD
jgi:hypothetical protein